MTKLTRLIIVTISSLLLLSGCSFKQQGESITAVGSSALQPLVEVLAEQYAKDHPGKFINVQGGGSGTGLSQIQVKAVDMGNSDVFAEEKSGIDATKLVDHQVAVVGIVPVVNPDIKIKNLTMLQLAQIFSGEIKNWQEVGGPDLPIVLINRAQGSGTRATFEQLVMKKRKTKQAPEQDSSGMVRQIVGNTPGAISYLAFPYVNKQIKTLNINQATPTQKDVTTNKWPIWSYEHIYTYGQPKGLTKTFLDYILSDNVQHNEISKMGYVPVTKMQVKRSVDGVVTPIK